MHRQILFILTSCLLVARQLPAQDLNESNFDHYTTSDGLSNNVVTGILQDSTGYIWIGTAYGLNRFNGSRFIQFHSSSDSLSIAAEEIAAMAWLGRNRLAAFTTGLYITDTKTGKGRNLYVPYHNRQYQFKYNMIERAMGDENGDVYVLTRSGFYHFDQAYKLLSRFDYYREDQVPVTHFFFGRGLFELDDHRLMIITIAGLYIYDKDRRQFRKMIAADCPLAAEFLKYPADDYQFFPLSKGKFIVMKSFSDSIVYISVPENKKTISRTSINPLVNEIGWRSRVIKVNDTLFYLTGHNSGFFRMHVNPETGVVRLNPSKEFAAYLCTGLLTDKENNLWIATTRGVFRYNPHKSKVQIAELSPTLENMFPNIRVDDIYVSDNKVYAGARGNAGLFVFDKKTLSLEKQVLFKHNKDDSRVNHIRAVVPLGGSNLLIGTIGPVVEFNMATMKERQVFPPEWNQPGDWTSDMYRDRRGNIWISANHIYKFDPSKNNYTIIPGFKRLLTVPFELTEDTAGNIWMAGHGLARYNIVSDSFDLVVDSFPFIKIPDKQINAMVIDRQNTLWFNSNNNGLTGYDVATKKFRQYTKANGLPDNNVASLIVIGNKLWIACYSGIACLDLATSQIVSFGKEDGFPDMPIVKGTKFFYDEREQQLYIGFATAVARFNPNDILRKKSPPHTFIENLVINGKEAGFLPEPNITTSWQKNDIGITIGTINFSDGNMQRFAYRIIKGGNNAWTDLGTQSSFNISSLSPGTNRIQVRVYSPNNRWPQQVKEMNIVVLPPFWQKGWFIALMFVATMLTIYSFVQWRTSAATRKEMEKTHIESLKADHYKSQFELEHISNYFSSSLADKKTEDEVLWDVAGNLIGKMNYVDCIIYLWNEDKTRMVQKAAYGPKGTPEDISAQFFDVLPGQGIVGHVMQTHLPDLVKDTRLDSRYRVDDAFRLSEVCVPIIHNDELMGIIDSEHPEANYFSERDIKILTTIATLIANKLKQIESEQSLEVKEKELTNTNEQLAEARLSALQAQMNPHFVFNALNSIKRMILEGDNEKASRYLSKFALMIRMTLNHSKEIFVTLDENIQYLKAYLEMEQLRFDDSFTFCIETSPNIDLSETTIPSMMIQPLVENAIWHGLLPGDGEKKIRIRFTECDNRITCMIEDNGIGIRQSEKLKERNRPSHQSVGLENLKKRIKIMNEKYDMDFTLKITDLQETGMEGTGTTVVLQFNLINA